jgi:hypothetical protein
MPQSARWRFRSGWRERVSTTMMKHALACMILLSMPIAAIAEQRQQPPSKPPPRQVKRNVCADYGPGFVAVEGSSTCVRVGGSIGVGGGGRAAR